MIFLFKKTGFPFVAKLFTSHFLGGCLQPVFYRQLKNVSVLPDCISDPVDTFVSLLIGPVLYSIFKGTY